MQCGDGGTSNNAEELPTDDGNSASITDHLRGRWVTQTAPSRRGETLNRPPVGSDPEMKTFDQLFGELVDRQQTRPSGSATVEALDAGVHAQGKKVVEEAAEVWMAAEHESADRTAEEISQLLYRIQVIMLGKGITLEDVYRHL